MTCEEFMASLQHQIDQRESLEHNDLLQDHASQCVSCHQHLIAWQQVASVLPSRQPSQKVSLADSDSQKYRGELNGSRARMAQRSIMVAMLLAAAAVLIFAFRLPESPESSIASADPGPSLPSTHAENVGLPINGLPMLGAESSAYMMRTNPVAWFQDVQQRDWLGQTMPTVESFRDGVAPIGRSLLRAVTILTTSGHGRPS
ncbi:hypothetical protein SH528x_006562 [Novipirellula sp. SH528]|uniref:hypothetical protein n=1 Tax=Novipirellula sp. SH528 TaxID=3454466 RepID=UPI003FA0E2CE